MLSTSIIRVRQRVILQWPLRTLFPSNMHVQLERSRHLFRTTCSCAHQTRQIKTPANSRYLFPSPTRSLAAFKFAKQNTMSTTANPPVEVDHDQYRLPTNVKATHYDVTIKTDLEKLTFQGFVKIRYVGIEYLCVKFIFYVLKASMWPLGPPPSPSMHPTWISVLRESWFRRP